MSKNNEKDLDDTTVNPGDDTSVTTPPEKPKKGKKVEVDAEFLERLMGTLETQGKEIKKLTEIADKGRLAHYEQTHQGESPRIYRLSTYQDKVITSWEMTSNNVWKDAEGHWKERQEIEITVSGGEKLKLPYVEFVTNTQKVPAKLLAIVQKGGKTIFEVEAEDGKKYVLDSTFIN